MEEKKFSLYKEEEREALLMHWWYYYGKLLVTMDETEQFYDLVKKNSLLMWNVAAVSYLSDLSSQPLINAMRSNRVSEYLKEVREFSSSEDYREISKKIEPAFLSMVVDSYNNPEPAIPFSKEEIVSQIMSMYQENHGDRRTYTKSKSMN